MKRDLADWLNGLGVPDDEDAPVILRPVEVELEDVKAAPDLSELSELKNESIEAARDDASVLLVELEHEPEDLEDNLAPLAHDELGENTQEQENLENENAALLAHDELSAGLQEQNNLENNLENNNAKLLAHDELGESLQAQENLESDLDNNAAPLAHDELSAGLQAQENLEINNNLENDNAAPLAHDELSAGLQAQEIEQENLENDNAAPLAHDELSESAQEQENLEDNLDEGSDSYFDELFSPRPQDEYKDLEQPAGKKNKFITEQDELQRLADELLLEDKDSYVNNKPEYNNYSLNDIQQLEDYVEQLENLLDEQEGVLREELSKRPDSANVKDVKKDVKDIKAAKEVKEIKEVKSEPHEDAAGVEEQLNAVFNGVNNNNNNKILVKERNGEFTQQLHGALHNRKVLAIEKSDLAGKLAVRKVSKKLKIAAACAVLLSLALAGACVTLLYLRNKAYNNPVPLHSQNVNLNLNESDLNNSQSVNNVNANLNNSDLNNLQGVNNVNANLNNSDLNNLQGVNNVNANLNDSDLNNSQNVNDVNANLNESDLSVNNVDANLNESDLSVNNVNASLNEMSVQNNLSADGNNLSLSFQDLLDAGSLALNNKEWDDAILSFYKACELNSRDVTARVGLAGAYYGKGMYHDAMIIISETRRKFPLDATIETMRRMLRRVK